MIQYLHSHVTNEQLNNAVSHLQKDYQGCLLRAKEQVRELARMEDKWNIPPSKMAKIIELFADKWIEDTWTNFVECLKQNSSYGR